MVVMVVWARYHRINGSGTPHHEEAPPALARGPSLAEEDTQRVSGAAGVSARSLRRPTLVLAVAINHVAREADEWFDEPDDLDRLASALAAIATSHGGCSITTALTARSSFRLMTVLPRICL